MCSDLTYARTDIMLKKKYLEPRQRWPQLEPFQGLQAKRTFAKACCRKKAPIEKGHGIYNNLPDKNNLNLIPKQRPINQHKAAYRKTRSLQKHIHIQKQSEEG